MAYVQGVFELGTDGPSLIIAALDGSETSLRAGAYAAGLARRQGSKLALVFVHTVGGFARSVPGAVPAVNEANRMTAEDLKQTIDEQASHLGIDARFYEREGSALRCARRRVNRRGETTSLRECGPLGLGLETHRLAERLRVPENRHRCRLHGRCADGFTRFHD